MISKILVANRGEIARRIFRTCHDMGLSTVAVYSDADAGARFVSEADEAVPIGGTTPADSYLQADAVLAAARAAGADAIHPGYGFLSENADFAQACEDAGVTFIGPSPDAIRLMGSKLTARALMHDAGVPVLPGFEVADTSPDELQKAAESIGWPVLVKASAGGGGRGMRIVHDADALADAVASAQREALSAFGDGTVYLERYVENPRHIEIQIFGDSAGNVVHLLERECSIQRRHQKIIEESPSPALTDALRGRMTEAAVAAGRAIGYRNAGTVEFILGPTGEFFFLEVNTRLQVEHPVTELVTGLDLVRLQIAVAAGEPLPAEAMAVTAQGHAIEARLYAEDVLNGYLPAAGPLEQFWMPDVAGVRVDAGPESGEAVSVHYDPMLAKVIAHGATRAEAARRLRRALQGARVHGVVTNRSLLVAILNDEQFLAGAIDTHFLQRRPPDVLLQDPSAVREDELACIAALVAQRQANRDSAPVLRTLPPGWRNNPSARRSQAYSTPLGTRTASVLPSSQGGYEVDGVQLPVQVLAATASRIELLAYGIRRTYDIARSDDRIHVDSTQYSVTLRTVPRFPDTAAHTTQGGLTAPMPATVVNIAVKPQDHVELGDVLVVLEAMKMEHKVLAPHAGRVDCIDVTLGGTVDAGQLLVVVTPAESPDASTEEPRT